MIFKWVLNKAKQYQESRKNAQEAAIGKYMIMQWAKVYPGVQIGKYSYIAHHAVINNAKIGNYTSIGPHCTIGFGDHPIGLLSLSPYIYKNNLIYDSSFTKTLEEECNRPVVIGHDVWIGANAVIRNGITIGDGAIIGAGSIVLSDVEPFSIHYGVPAKKQRMRFSETEIQKLKELEWWVLDVEQLADKIKNDPAYQFLSTYKNYKV